MIRLVISDVDGTLLTPEKHISALSKMAVASLTKAGVRFTLISSRPAPGMQWVCEELDIREPIAAFNGALIADPQGKVIFATYIEPQIARAVVRAVQQAGASPWVYTPEEWLILPNQSAHVEHEADTVRFRPQVVHDFEAYFGRVIKVQAVSDDSAVIARCAALIHEAAVESVSATRSQTYYYDVTPPGGNKGEGTSRLCSCLGVPLTETATLGDMENDIPMLKIAGFSIAMGQATAEVKAAAKAAAPSNGEEGFASAIYRFILRQELPAAAVPAKSA